MDRSQHTHDRTPNGIVLGLGRIGKLTAAIVVTVGVAALAHGAARTSRMHVVTEVAQVNPAAVGVIVLPPVTIVARRQAASEVALLAPRGNLAQ